MGASFRNLGEILQLAGCDKLTIAPKFLNQMKDNTIDPVIEYLSIEKALHQSNIPKKISPIVEHDFRWKLCQNAMATEKLAEGIRNFAKDIITLENIIKTKLQ